MRKFLVALGLVMAFSAPTFASTNDGDRQIPGPITGAKKYPYEIQVWRTIKGDRNAPDQIQIVYRTTGVATMTVINSIISDLQRRYIGYRVSNVLPVPYEPDEPIVIEPWDPNEPIKWKPKRPDGSVEFQRAE
ncbi:hypothetical protein [Myroides odoratus]|uniref:Uncharacterized protein n=1 Tax=Myroides odoratus TaxID=256 RepID=A0A9Q6ZA10_MYROD|nr:hypothetical protein [Myroides odoratus]EHQ42260.1 hypothetical protein Myrod_1427 [Myroides odoratus DSM 2801]EKB09450.1 hypothetical protein HMPREF9716_00066 [Myroides odoratus CIP 103059]QQT99639.1 hypothetical protein I6I88_15890 [Myroides odoratus]WQD58153.1 hypothetical protein U0010_03065 [Myroides odoratus]STZ29520.1 Uncharacterised protein [Myroides odoratus]